MSATTANYPLASGVARFSLSTTGARTPGCVDIAVDLFAGIGACLKWL